MTGEDDPAIHCGLTCTSGPLGGDAQIAALMCMEDLGGIIFFVDPLSAHPHQADIDSLLRLANCGNVIVCPNPASASSMMHTLRSALLKGERARGIIPSFFETLESPAVEKYKHAQAVALANMIKGSVPVAAPQAAVVPKPTEEKKATEEGRRAALFKCEDHIEEAPLKQGWKKAALSDSAVDHALMGQSMIFSADLQALLLSELDNEDYLKEEEDDDVVVAAPKTALSAPAAAAAAAANEEKKAMEEGGRSATDLVEDVETNNKNHKKAVPPKRRMYSKKAVPSMSDSVVDLALMGLDYSTHLEGLMVLEEEDEEVEDVSEEDDPEEEDDDAEDDSEEEEEGEDEDVVFPAPIAKAKLLKSLFGFKTSSLMSKGRTDVKMFSKTVRKQRQHSEKEKAPERQAVPNLREGLLTAKRDLKQRGKEHKKQVERLKRQCELQENDRSYDKSLTSMEQRTSALEEGQLELLVLAKQQMKLIEYLTEHHARAHA